MATYQNLCAADGGGVLTDRLKDRRSNDFSICIGLGGTGIDALKKLKKQVYRQLKADEPDSLVPSYKNIRFLAVDINFEEMFGRGNVSDLDRCTEFFDLSNSDMDTILRTESILEARKELSWINYKNLNIRDCGCGAGGIKQIGRFCLIDKASMFKAKLTSIIREAAGSGSGRINVHVFSGLSGGIGSGTFIDVCYILRHVLAELGVEDSFINGCFFLPDVNLSLPYIAADPFASRHIQVQGYASLKELDYLMNLEERRDRFVQNYGSFEIQTSQPPVDCCNLFSAAAASGVHVKNGYDHALSAAADYVLSLLMEDSGAANPLRILKTPPQTTRKHGAVHKYNFISVTQAEIPAADMLTCLGSGLFLRFDHMFRRTPAEEDLKELVDACAMNFEQLMEQLTGGISYRIPYPVSLRREKDIIPGDKRVISCADIWTANALGTLEENRKTMLEGLNHYEIPTDSSSVIARLFSCLCNDYAMNPAKGPVFAQKLLGGMENKNLLHIIDWYIQINEEHMEAERRQEPLRRQELDCAGQDLARANFINRRGRIEKYLTAVSNWYLHLAALDKHMCMKYLLRELKEQVCKMINEFFLVMTTVLSTLNNTFQENDQFFTEMKNSTDPCTIQIPSCVSHMKAYLDNTAGKVDDTQEFKKLVKLFIDNPADWIAQDENKIALMISEYIVQAFPSFVNFNLDSWQNFSQKSQDTIIRELAERFQEPLLCVTPGFRLEDMEKRTILLVPPHWTAAASQVFQNGFCYICPKSADKRITSIKMYCGAPLYAYQGLADLEKVYEEHRDWAGLHLYEREDMDWREYLPSPIPASYAWEGHSIPRINEQNRKLTEELEEAFGIGIVCRSTQGWIIKRARTDIPSLIRQVKEYEDNFLGDMLKLAETLDLVREARERLYDNGKTELILINTSNSAGQNFDNSLLSDDYLRSPALHHMVRKELEKVHTLDEKISRLTGFTCLGACAPSRPCPERDFFDAVFTGVIKMKKQQITFSWEQFGVEEVFVLQNPYMPYGTKAPLYQAWLTYRDADDDIVKRIVEKTSNAFDNMTDEIYEVSKKIRARYSYDYLKMTLDTAADDPRQNEIQKFYNEFMKELQNYIVTYM